MTRDEFVKKYTEIAGRALSFSEKSRREGLLALDEYLLALKNMQKEAVLMIHEGSNPRLIYAGMDCLLEKLGVLETEAFISNLLRERFDYTEWQRDYFDKYTLDDFLKKAVDYDKSNPFKQE